MVEEWWTASWEEKQEMREDLVPALTEINGYAKPQILDLKFLFSEFTPSLTHSLSCFDPMLSTVRHRDSSV